MKKMSLLVLALIVALPGCGKKKESSRPVKKNTVERYMETADENEVVEVDMGDDAALEDFFGSDDEDEEEEEFDGSVAMDDDGAYSIEDTDIEENDGAFNWIDAQTDDEFRKLYFTFNHYGIREDQKEALKYDIEQVKQLVAEADSSAQPTVVIEGHACQEGTPAYNLALSEKRAKNVADLFVASGVDRNFIKIVGRGQECPAVINAGTREGRAPNRRVEVHVIYT